MANLGLRIGTTAILAVGVATLAGASPAAADVTVTPSQAVQGDAGRLTFRIGNDSRTASLVGIELRLPADNPIAEVYPLSAPKWAPRITTRPLTGSLPGLHGGRVGDITTRIAWTPGPGGALKPGQAVQLSVALGPLPQTPTLQLNVLRRYSDGTVTKATGRPGQPGAEQLTVTLLPPAAGADAPAPAGGHGHGGTAARPAAGAPDTAPAPAADPASAGGSGVNWWTAAGWACAALIGCYALSAVRRSRRNTPTAARAAGPPATSGRTDERPLVASAANTSVRPPEMGSRWTYRERG